MIIGGRTVEFDSETHIYKVDGVVVKSVTNYLNDTVFKGKYGNVPIEVLERARKFGHEIHNAIEFEDDFWLSDLQRLKYNEFFRMIKQNDIEIVEKEQIVYYVIDDEVVYIGKFDLIVYWLNELFIADVKTTYNLDYDYLSYQLGFYKLAYEQLYNKKIADGLAFWLPKRKSGEMVKITPKSKNEVLELVLNGGNV